MTIQELLLNEVMESGFPFKRSSSTSWVVNVPEKSTSTNKPVNVIVDTPYKIINNTLFVELSFRIEGSKTIQLEDIFIGSSIFKLFNSIVQISEGMNADVIVFIPNDINVDIGNKKAKVYMAIMRRMKTRGLIARIEEIVDPSGHIFQFCFPSTSRSLMIDEDQLQQIAIEYFGSKV